MQRINDGIAAPSKKTTTVQNAINEQIKHRASVRAKRKQIHKKTSQTNIPISSLSKSPHFSSMAQTLYQQLSEDSECKNHNNGHHASSVPSPDLGTQNHKKIGLGHTPLPLPTITLKTHDTIDGIDSPHSPQSDHSSGSDDDIFSFVNNNEKAPRKKSSRLQVIQTAQEISNKKRKKKKIKSIRKKRARSETTDPTPSRKKFISTNT